MQDGWVRMIAYMTSSFSPPPSLYIASACEPTACLNILGLLGYQSILHEPSSNHFPLSLWLMVLIPPLVSIHQSPFRSGSNQIGLIKVGLLTHSFTLPKLIGIHFLGLLYLYHTLSISQHYCRSANTVAHQLNHHQSNTSATFKFQN
jgi:hypothetical protein